MELTIIDLEKERQTKISATNKLFSLSRKQAALDVKIRKRKRELEDIIRSAIVIDPVNEGYDFLELSFLVACQKAEERNMPPESVVAALSLEQRERLQLGTFSNCENRLKQVIHLRGPSAGRYLEALRAK